MGDRLRFGFIGLGVGAGQAREVSSMPELAEVAALADIDEARLSALADQMGPDVRTFTDYREMLKLDNLDAVVVGTPNYLHRDMTVAALESGKHVLCQKPPAMNARETREMFDAAHRCGRVLMISLNQRFEYSNLWLKRLVDEGELGEPYWARASWLRRRQNPPGWFVDKARAGGGPLIDLGVHVLDLALSFMGYPTPKSVMAQVVNKLTPQATVEDLAMAFVSFEGGAAMTVENSLNLNIGRERITCEVAGTKGGLQAYPPAFFTERAGESIDLQPVQTGRGPQEPQGMALMRHFIECVRSGREPLVTRDQMLKLTAILDAIYLSGETGREEAVEA